MDKKKWDLSISCLQETSVRYKDKKIESEVMEKIPYKWKQNHTDGDSNMHTQQKKTVKERLTEGKGIKE